MIRRVRAALLIVMMLTLQIFLFVSAETSARIIGRMLLLFALVREASRLNRGPMVASALFALALELLCVVQAVAPGSAAFTQVAVNGGTPLFPATSPGINATIYNSANGVTGTSIGLPFTTVWQPGVTYNKIPASGTAGNMVPSTVSTGYGIPSRSTIYTTINPSGDTSGATDRAAITTACNACPAGEIVQLGAGLFYIDSTSVIIRNSNFTLRGTNPLPATGATGGLVTQWGPGGGQGFTPYTDFAASGAGGSYLLQVATSPSQTLVPCVLLNAQNTQNMTSSTNITADTVFGAYSCTVTSTSGLSVGQIVLLDHITDGFSPATNYDQNVFWGYKGATPHAIGNGGGNWICRTDRSISQLMEIASIVGSTVTFTTPFHYNFQTACNAQLSVFGFMGTPTPWVTGVGFEQVGFMNGTGGDGGGNLIFSCAAYCWIKNCESYWQDGGGFGLYSCFRCEIRDSYMHEASYPEPGGGGYLCVLSSATSDCLVENNIMWAGNKQNVMRGTGGGNVLAYNYMDDAFGASYPNQVEAGVNSSHFTTPHFELIEGNYSHNYTAEEVWGNTIYITVFRNHLSMIRAAYAQLSTFTYFDGVGTIPYIDAYGRYGVNLQAYSFFHSIVGNVIGNSGQSLIGYIGYQGLTQTAWAYENLDGLQGGSGVPLTTVPIYYVGADQAFSELGGPWSYQPNTYKNILRQGNWDWFSSAQKWHGLGGSDEYGGNPSAPHPSIPNSLYLTSIGGGQPVFWTNYINAHGATAWPWVNPANGVVTILPAKARFDAGTPNTVP